MESGISTFNNVSTSRSSSTVSRRSQARRSVAVAPVFKDSLPKKDIFGTWWPVLASRDSRGIVSCKSPTGLAAYRLTKPMILSSTSTCVKRWNDENVDVGVTTFIGDASVGNEFWSVELFRTQLTLARVDRRIVGHRLQYSGVNIIVTAWMRCFGGVALAISVTRFCDKKIKGQLVQWAWMLEDYLTEFERLADQVESRLDVPGCVTEKAPFINKSLKELKYYLDSVDLSLRGLSRDARQRYISRQQQCRSRLDALQRKWLLACREPSSLAPHAGSAAQKAFDSLESAKKSAQTLEEALRMASDSERTGTSILTNLHSQRESLEKTQRNVSTIEHRLSESDTVVTRMSRWWNQLL